MDMQKRGASNGVLRCVEITVAADIDWNNI